MKDVLVVKVKLISSTVGVNGESLKDLVVYCARVSNPKSQEEGKNINKLWNYLKKHGHWSPFEMVDLCMEIECPRDISRQLIRHRSFSFQEFSQRYSNPILEGLDLSFRETRLQDYKNRQNSIETEDESIIYKWVQLQSKMRDVVLGLYSSAVDLGVAKEVARALLPEGMTNSRIYMKGSLRSWMHFIEVRSHESAQKEIREIANQCDKIITDILEKNL
tara:strand:+ start:222 stop:878 length:657 start_codon:yes stop_codon:yes gene_type:complete